MLARWVLLAGGIRPGTNSARALVARVQPARPFGRAGFYRFGVGDWGFCGTEAVKTWGCRGAAAGCGAVEVRHRGGRVAVVRGVGRGAVVRRVRGGGAVGRW